MSNEAVEQVIRAKAKLEELPVHLRNNHFNIILKCIDLYLKRYCNHSVISDLIDIDCDKSITIFYCQNCLLSFENNLFPEIVDDTVD
jgi:hypothetical protein